MTTVSAAPKSDAGERAVVPLLSEILDQARDENFPVALRLLPSARRRDLEAIYGFARLVDDIGDEATGDRLAQLDWVERELDRALADEPAPPVIASAAELALRIGAGREPFVALIDANRQDQRVSRYETIGDLEAYCALSANPVGRLVLAVFGADSATARDHSDEICTGLQLIEHLQDIGEDYAAGRVYLPSEDLRRFGVAEDELGAPRSSNELRRLIAFECGRARAYLSAGAPLVRMVHGAGRLAIAGFAGGGIAQLKAIENARFDTLAKPVKASKLTVARCAAVLLAGRR